MNQDPMNILVLDETAQHHIQVARLKDRILGAGIQLCSTPSKAGPHTYTLVHTTDKLELRPPDSSLGQPFSVDFSNSQLLYRLAKGGGRKQEIARAVGVKKETPHIIDATCGFARDGFILASLGCTVELCERSPITHALVNDALQRATNNTQIATIAARIRLHLGDSLELIPSLSSVNPADVIYLDPMYPHRTKSALVKKQMRLLRQIVGQDTDAAELHATALAYARKRVVCKRPNSANFINDKKPAFAIKGTKHRFDVYLTNVP